MNKNPVITLIDSPPEHQADTIRIFLNDCLVDLRVGIHTSEAEKPQPVIISVEIEALLPHHYKDVSEKKLDRVINYEPIYQFIQNELPTIGHIYLLESVAEQIIDFCFGDVRVRKVSVRLEKTEIFEDAKGAGIEIIRTRGGSRT